jgi:branched-chain amino acid transport system ATP-binding protein
MSPLLATEGLEAFYGASQILRGIDLTVRRGEQVALIGRNGMGKTTLLRSLIGLVADRRGRILLDGHDVGRAAPEEIAQRGVAFVPDGRGVFGSLTVVENLVMASRAGLDGRRTWTLDRVFDLFPRLHQRRSHGGHQLSGGEQQMLALGRALMTNPDLLLIDEATEGLAPLIAQEIWRTLDLARREGIASIVVDRDLDHLCRFADRLLVLAKGAVVFEAAAQTADRGLIERHLGIS